MLHIAVFQGLRSIVPGSWRDIVATPATGIYQKIAEGQKILEEEGIEIEGYPLNLFDYCEGKIPPLLKHTLTVFEHPMIFLTSIALWKIQKPPCDAIIGFSMGEWIALVAAGCLDFRTGFLTVIKRGILASQTGGSSLLLRGAQLPIKRLQTLSALTKGVWLSSINSYSQGVISGKSEKVEKILPELKEHYPQVRITPIDIGGAFHTPRMNKARRGMEEYLAGVPFTRPRIPMITNATGEIQVDPEEIKQQVLAQMTRRLFLPRTARRLPPHAHFHEIAVPPGARPIVSQFLQEGRERLQSIPSRRRVAQAPA